MQDHQQQKFALTTVSKACFIAFSVMSAPLLAAETSEQTSTAEQESNIEVISVTGVRGSLSKSMNDKRFSTEIKDTISAEDIGQLPDENIAEALQRVTGIQMQRSADGEGSSVQIRGISNNNVEINGQVSSGSGDSRGVNFQDLPSELFSGIEVLKAPTADKIEGSLGGTVNLKTRRPLEMNKDSVGTVTSKAKYNEQSGQTDPDFNTFFGKNLRDTKIGDIGFIINAGRKNYSSKTSVFGGGDYNDAEGSWLKRDGSEDGKGSIDVNGDGQVNGDDVYYIPNGLKAYSTYRESQRDSFNSTIQWQPNDRANFYFDYTYTASTEFQSGSQASSVANSSRSDIDGDYEWSGSDLGDGSYIINEGVITDASMRMGGSPSVIDTEQQSHNFTLGGDYQLSDNAFLEMKYNYAKGKKTTSQASMNMGYDWNYDGWMSGKDWAGSIWFEEAGNGIPSGGLVDEDGNPIDITNLEDPRLAYFQMQRNANDIFSEDNAFTMDLTYELDHDFFTQIKTGLRIAARNYERFSYQNINQNGKHEMVDGKYLNVNVQKYKVDPDANGNPTNAQVSRDLQQCLAITDAIHLGDSNLPTSWVTTNCNSDFYTDYFNLHDIRAVDADTGYGYYEQVDQRYDIGESSYALYLRTDFNSELFDLPFYGNIGARYVETTVNSSGYERLGIINDELAYEWSEHQNTYQDFLPSMNLNLALNNEMIMRFSASKAMQRPGLVQTAPSTTYKPSSDIDGYNGTALVGNPDLDPVRAWSADLSYEWYYSSESMLSAALFYKDLDSIITYGYAYDMELEGQNWQARQWQNMPGTTIKGVELAVQHSFSNLPGFLAHTGTGANYTFSDDDSEFYDLDGNQISRKGLSRHSYNVYAFYDNGKFSTRLAYNWRSEYTKRELVQLGWGADDYLTEIENARGQLDLTANYSINKQLKINFSAVNLTNSKTERYLYHEELTNYMAEMGRRFNIGLVYRF